MKISFNLITLLNAIFSKSQNINFSHWLYNVVMIQLSMFSFSQSTNMIWITTFPEPTAVSLSIFS